MMVSSLDLGVCRPLVPRVPAGDADHHQARGAAGGPSRQSPAHLPHQGGRGRQGRLRLHFLISGQDPLMLQIPEYLEKLQSYLCRLTYNHTGTQLFDIKPHSSMITLMDTAKAMVRESLPIKCMEAVILAICLTNGIPGLGRFPINFKSEVNEASLLKGRKYYYHVVLGIAYKVRQTFDIRNNITFEIYPKGKFGALGLSRRSSLMFKRLEYSSLHSLVEEYKRAYLNCGHTLLKVSHQKSLSSRHFLGSGPDWRAGDP